MITLTQLQACCTNTPGRNTCKSFVDYINANCGKYGINTSLRMAHFLAQILHESGQFYYLQEIASGHAYDLRADLGNTKADAINRATRHGVSAGQFYKGHGLIQITGYTNHAACSQAIYGDDRLLDNPILIAQPEGAVLSAMWFWQSHGLNDLADADNIEKITRRVNGGLNGFDDRKMFLARAKSALGV